jgi:uncharacterized membrane protein
MKTLTLKTLIAVSSIAALTSLTIVPAAADTPKVDYSNLTNFESIKSREQVKEEYFQAMKDGSLAKATAIATDVETPFVAKSAPSNLMRDDVYAETVEWLRTKATSIGMGE